MHCKVNSKVIWLTPLKNNTPNYTVPSSKGRKFGDPLKRKQRHVKIITTSETNKFPIAYFVHCNPNNFPMSLCDLGKLPMPYAFSCPPVLAAEILSAGPIVAFENLG